MHAAIINGLITFAVTFPLACTAWYARRHLIPVELRAKHARVAS